MTSPIGISADAGRPVSHVRLFLAQRDGDDGLQSLSPAPPGTVRPPRSPKSPGATGAYGQDAGRHPARQQSDQFGCSHAGQRHRHRAVRGGQMGTGCRHPGRHLRHPGLFGNHPENHRRHLCGPACPGPGYILTPLLRLFYPAVWFINLFASVLLKVLRLSPKPGGEATQLSPEELRSLVLESIPSDPAETSTPFCPACST